MLKPQTLKPSQVLLIFVCFALPFIFPSVVPHRWIFGSCFVLGYLFYSLGQRPALDQLGLNIPRRQAALALILFLGLGWMSWRVVESISTAQGWYNAVDFPYDWERWLGSFFQVFNEEIVFRAFLLCQLSRFIRNELAAASIQTFLNIVGHYIAALLIFSEIFSGTALVSIVLFNFGANLLFLRLGHIGFSLAAHAAWNVIRHGSYRSIINPAAESVIFVREADEYAVFEGSTQVMAAAAIFLACSIAAFFKKSEAEKQP